MKITCQSLHKQNFVQKFLVIFIAGLSALWSDIMPWVKPKTATAHRSTTQHL
jgi:hypothetical protein